MNAGAITQEAKHWTYSTYAALDDGRRYEVVVVDLIMAPAPYSAHQRVSRNLEFILWNFVKERQLGEIFNAPFDVVLDEENVVQPDLVFIDKAHLGRIEKHVSWERLIWPSRFFLLLRCNMIAW